MFKKHIIINDIYTLLVVVITFMSISPVFFSFLYVITILVIILYPIFDMVFISGKVDIFSEGNLPENLYFLVFYIWTYFFRKELIPYLYLLFFVLWF